MGRPSANQYHRNFRISPAAWVELKLQAVAWALARWLVILRCLSHRLDGTRGRWLTGNSWHRLLLPAATRRSFDHQFPKPHLFRLMAACRLTGAASDIWIVGNNHDSFFYRAVHCGS